MSRLRETDHSAVYSFLRELETKGLPGGWSGYGGNTSVGVAGNSVYPYVRRLQPGAQYDYEAQAGEIWENGVAALALAWLGRNFPEPRVCVKRQMKANVTQEVEGHEAVTLLAKPNEFYDADVLWTGILVSFFCDGNAYLVKGRNANGFGQTKQLYYVPHFQIFPRWPSDGSVFISHYEMVIDGRRVPLRRDQVVHFKTGVDMQCHRFGRSALKAELREVCTDNDASNYSAAILRNFGVPGLSISPEADGFIEKDQRDEMKDIYREELTGENRGGFLINSVPVKVDVIGASPEKMALDTIRHIPEARICAAFGLHPQVLGLTAGESSKTFANYAEARRAAYDDCLTPTQKRLGKQFTAQCPELFTDPRDTLAWDYAGVTAMQEDANNKGRRAVVLFQGQLAKRDEARAIADLPPLGGPEGEAMHEGAPASGTGTSLGETTMGGSTSA